jgi:hypothetical protein
MKKLVKSTEKHDPSYKKETTATAAGAAILLFTVFNIVNEVIPRESWFLFTAPVRILAVIWVVRISDRQNRDPLGNGFAAFLAPGLTLGIIGLLKKRTLRFKLDDKYPPEVQARALRKYAAEFIRKKRYTEAVFIYEYIGQYLSAEESDKQILEELKVQLSAEQLSVSAAEAK